LEKYNNTLEGKERDRGRITSVTAMDPRESGRGQVESGNPKTKSRRE